MKPRLFLLVTALALLLAACALGCAHPVCGGLHAAGSGSI